MRAMADKTIKVCLTNRGEDSETPWAHDLGPAPGPKGSRRVRLVNVPFLHAKPTWGDVIVVSPVEEGFPTWDREGVTWAKIGTRIAEDGGRWAMIVDYTARAGDRTGENAFRALAKACEAADIVCEGAWAPDERPGRVYLAVKLETTPEAAMAMLRAAAVPCELTQVHPAPSAPKASGVRRQASATKQTEKTKSKAQAKAKPQPKKKTKAKRAAAR
jgi:hypothetical protein